MRLRYSSDLYVYKVKLLVLNFKCSSHFLQLYSLLLMIADFFKTYFIYSAVSVPVVAVGFFVVVLRLHSWGAWA